MGYSPASILIASEKGSSVTSKTYVSPSYEPAFDACTSVLGLPFWFLMILAVLALGLGLAWKVM